MCEHDSTCTIETPDGLAVVCNDCEAIIDAIDHNTLFELLQRPEVFPELCEEGWK